MQYVDQLRDGVPLLHNDFARPVGQHLMAVLHAGGHSWGEDGHGLAYNGPGLHCVGLQQAVEDLFKTYRPCIVFQTLIFYIGRVVRDHVI